MSMRNKVAAMLAAFFTGAIVQPVSADDLFHYTLAEQHRELPKKILVLPMDLRVKQINEGELDTPLEKESKEIQALYQDTLKQSLAKNPLGGRFELYTPSSAEDGTQIDQAQALYQVVAGSVLKAQGLSGWNDRLKRFDYTLGPILPQLREKTGADAILFVSGEDYVSSGGRVALAVFSAIAFGRIYIPSSPSYMVVGLVDIKSGDLLWLSSESNSFASISNKESAQQQVDTHLKTLFNKMAAKP